MSNLWVENIHGCDNFLNEILCFLDVQSSLSMVNYLLIIKILYVIYSESYSQFVWCTVEMKNSRFSLASLLLCEVLLSCNKGQNLVNNQVFFLSLQEKFFGHLNKRTCNILRLDDCGSDPLDEKVIKYTAICL